MEDHTHAELLALYEDASRNLDHLKKGSISMLTYYTAISVFFVHEKDELKSLKELVLFLLLVAAYFCIVYVCNNYRLIVYRREILKRVFEEFSSTFRKARNPNDCEIPLQGVVNKGCIDRLMYQVSLTCPLVIYAITFLLIWPA